jgi:hypothetical protein
MRWRAGATDVFQVPSANNVLRPDFCSTAKPATSTTFGVYTLIGNDLGFKLNPLVKPQVQAALVPDGKKGNARVVCNIQNTVVVERAKYAAFFSTRSGITAGTFSEVGGTVTYRLLPSSDFETNFTHSEAGETWGSSKSFGSLDLQSTTKGIDQADVMPALAVSTPIINTTEKQFQLMQTLIRKLLLAYTKTQVRVIMRFNGSSQYKATLKTSPLKPQ